MQGPSRRIDGGSILEGSLCLSQNTREEIRLLSQKHPNILVAFGLIAGITCQAQIADAIRSPVDFGLNMLYLQRNMLRPTIATGPSPLLQQILPEFIAKERALLILQAADLGVLHPLQIELDQFQADGADGTQPHEPPRPGQHIGNSALQRGSKPAVFPSPVGKAWRSIAGFALSASSANRPALVKSFLDGVSPMQQFRRKDRFSRRIIDQGQSTRLAPRINLQPQRMNLWLLDGHFENEREGKAFEDSSFSLRQQDTGTARMNRIKWSCVYT